MTIELQIKGRAGDFEYGRAAANVWHVRDRRTGQIVQTQFPLRFLNDASRLARQLHGRDLRNAVFGEA
jgi:hypothetical protein